MGENGDAIGTIEREETETGNREIYGLKRIGKENNARNIEIDETIEDETEAETIEIENLESESEDEDEEITFRLDTGRGNYEEGMRTIERLEEFEREAENKEMDEIGSDSDNDSEGEEEMDEDIAKTESRKVLVFKPPFINGKASGE